LKPNFTPYIYILFFLLNIYGVLAQELRLTIEANLESSQKVLNQINFNDVQPSAESLHFEIDSIFSKLQIQGYLNARLDTIIILDTIYAAHFSLGKKLNHIKIYYDHISTVLLDEKDLNPIARKITASYFEVLFQDIQPSMQYLADLFEKKGNSFIKVSLDNIELIDQEARAVLKIEDKGQRTIDKVVVKGYEDFPRSYIIHELDLKVGSTFNREKLKLASQAVNNLPFAEEHKAPEVLFTNDSTLVYLFLKKKKSNQFDGIIGFASKEESSGLQFNGYLDLTINNIFNGG
jgi:translocation and assembly module TamA